MKNVISMTFIVMLVTFLFCACGAADVPAPAAEPTVPPVTMETEVLFFDGFVGLPQELVSTYDENGTLSETKKTEFHENGNISALIEARYDDSGNVIFYQETSCRPEGSTAAMLTKHYDAQGILTNQEEITYHESGAVSRREVRTFSPSGSLLTLEAEGCFDNGALAERMSEYYDPETDLRFIRQEIYHISGQLLLLRDGAFHPDTYALREGKTEEYSHNGPLIRTETAHWDSENRTHYRSYCRYDDHSSGQITECFDEFGRLILKESLIYEKNQVLFEHFVETCVYDRQGNPIEQNVQYYLSGGIAGERFETKRTYDDAGHLLRCETAHYLSGGKRQNLAVTEYTYDGEALIKEVQTSVDHKDIRKSCLTKEYDVFGAVTTFTTLSSSGNSYTYSYVYDAEGRVISELMTTNYKSAPRIDYQETSYEYHENGIHKSVTVHKWTSYDEARFPNADKKDLGQTTHKEYDENGNRV